MGESREGEGRAGGPTSDQVARTLVQEYARQGTYPSEIHIQKATEELFAVRIFHEGEKEPEAFFLVIEERESE